MMDLPIKLPALMGVLQKITEQKKLMKYGRSESEKLTLDICSFSYKRGIPDDTSGNGGGFVFDCRGIYNPGRFEGFRQLNGKDKEVIEFLEEKTEIGTFLENAKAMVELTVNNYVTRKFTHLMVGFGCTGGQHRSVYCAVKLAEYFKDRDDIIVQLNHY